MKRTLFLVVLARALASFLAVSCAPKTAEKPKDPYEIVLDGNIAVVDALVDITPENVDSFGF